MTNKEAFLSVIQIASVDENTLQLGLIEAAIDPTANFVKGSLKDLELAALPVLESLMSITSFSEGGFSQSINPDAIKERLLFIAKKHSVLDYISKYSSAPKISDASNLW